MFSKKYLEINSITKQCNTMELAHRVYNFCAAVKWDYFPLFYATKDIGSQRGTENTAGSQKIKLSTSRSFWQNLRSHMIL